MADPANPYFIQAQKDSDKSTIMFYKIHIPWPIFSKYAEELFCRGKIQVGIKRKFSSCM